MTQLVQYNLHLYKSMFYRKLATQSTCNIRKSYCARDCWVNNHVCLWVISWRVFLIVPLLAIRQLIKESVVINICCGNIIFLRAAIFSRHTLTALYEKWHFIGDDVSKWLLHDEYFQSCSQQSLQWRNNGHDSVSNHQPHDCLLNRCSGTDHRKHQSSASLAFVRGIHRDR